jgi:acetyl esterase/lipase
VDKVPTVPRFIGRDGRGRTPYARRDRPRAGTRKATDVQTIAYGEHPDQTGVLYMPAGGPPRPGWPVAVVVHGGSWREMYRRDLTAPAAADLSRRGIAAWNIEFRRVGGDGGWPTTFEDVAAAVDHLPDLDAPLDLDRLAIVGHSSGGLLALWALGRHAGDPRGAPRVRPAAGCVLAPIAALGSLRETTSDDPLAGLLGGTAQEVGDRWDAIDPVRRVGHGLPVVIGHGENDDSVPLEQSRAYLEAARAAGDPVELVTERGDHMAVVHPGSLAWQRPAERLADLLDA